VKKDAAYYDAARRKRNPGVATPDEVKALQAQWPSPERPNAGQFARSAHTEFAVSCPFCAARNVAPLSMAVHKKAPPPERTSGDRYGFLLWFSLGGLALLVSGWPLGDITAGVWMAALIPCGVFGFWFAEKQHAKFIATLPDKYVCRHCGLEGDFIHFHTPVQVAPGHAPETVIIDEILD